MSMIYGEWIKTYKCIECKRCLSNYEVYYSDGVCPHCGYINNSTIIDYTPVVIRRVYKRKWLIFKTLVRIEVKEST